MKRLPYSLLFALIAGCSVEHGQVDFASPPLFQVDAGDYSSFIFFSDWTVLKIGSTYYFLSIPFWLLLVFSVGFIALLTWLIYRKMRREPVA